MKSLRRRPGLLVLALVLSAAALVGTARAADPPYFSNVTADVGLDGVQAFRVHVRDLNGDGFPDTGALAAGDERARYGVHGW